MYEPQGVSQQPGSRGAGGVAPLSYGEPSMALQADPASPDSLGPAGLAAAAGSPEGIGSNDGEPGATMFVQRNLIKQLQRLVRQQSSRIEELQSEVQRFQQGHRATDVMYLERLQNQQQRLDERQEELQRVRREAETFRQEIEHLRSVMGGLETEADERERMFSQVYSLEREKVDRDRSKKAEALGRLEQQKQQLADENDAHISRLQSTEAELTRVCRALQDEERHLKAARQDAEAAKQERLALLEELKREQQEREGLVERHHGELRAMEQQLARGRQERKDERVELCSQVTELEIKNSVLESQVQRLEMELMDHRTTTTTHHQPADSPSRPVQPNSAVLLQLTRTEEEVQRLRQQLEVMEGQKRQYFTQLGELETRLSAQIQESKRAAQEGAAWREQRASLEKAVKGLGTEVDILKQDLYRSREKNAALEHSLLEVRLQWQKDKAMAAEREQETGLRTRSLEQQVEELTGELEVKCRELGKLQEAHTELQHKCTKLSLSKNGAVNDLMATMAAHDESYRQEQEQLQGQLEASKQLARDLQEELEAAKAESKAQAERAARTAESHRKEVHELHVEMGRLRVRVDEKQWAVQKLESSLAQVRQQQGEEAEGGGGATQQLKESLEAAKREIEKLRRERDAAAREAREGEQRLRAQLGELQARLDEQSLRQSSDRRRRRSEGEQRVAGLSMEEEEELRVLGIETPLSITLLSGHGHESPGQQPTGPSDVQRPNPWASVARLLSGQVPTGYDTGLSGQTCFQPRYEGSGLSRESTGQGCVAREGETVHGAGFVRPVRHSWDPATHRTDMDRFYAASSSGQRAQEPPAAIGRGPLRSTVSSRGREVLSRHWKAEAGAGQGGSPPSRRLRELHGSMHRPRTESRDDQQEDSPEAQDMAGERHGFGCWSGLPTGETDDSFPYVRTDRVAPPLEPPVPPLPSISSQHGSLHDDQDGDGSVAGTSVTGSVASLSKAKKRRPGTSDGKARRASTTSKRSRSTLKNQAPLVTSGAVAAAKLRRAVATPAGSQQPPDRARARTSSRSGSSGGKSITPRAAQLPSNTPRTQEKKGHQPAKPATASAARVGTAHRKSASTGKATTARLPKVNA